MIREYREPLLIVPHNQRLTVPVVFRGKIVESSGLPGAACDPVDTETRIILSPSL